jgi:hypothetical protein
LKTNSAAVKQYQESLSQDKEAQVLVTHATDKQNLSTVSLTGEKNKKNVMMMMHTENNASFFLLRKRSKY